MISATVMSRSLRFAKILSSEFLCDMQRNALHNATMEKHERLRKARSRKFKSAAEAARYLDIPYGTYAGHEVGTRGIKDDEMIRYAQVFRVPVEWLAYGIGSIDEAEHLTRIPVEGLVGAGGEIEPDYRDGDGENAKEIEVALNLQPGLVAFEVWGDSMLPKYDPGDFVIVHRDSAPPERILNDVALVVTDDGRRFIKRVRRGSREGLYNLESFNARTMEDVPVTHFGMIYLVLPAKQAHRPVAEKEVHRRSRSKKKSQAAE